MKKIVYWSFVSALLIAYLSWSVTQNLNTERNSVAIFTADPGVETRKLSVAVVGDVHLQEGPEALEKFQNLLREIKSTQPDLVVFVGDYTAGSHTIDDMPLHRANIINAMKLINPLPRAVVLGNYESWSDADEWLGEFARLGVDAIENETRAMETDKGPVCVRGLGDKFTERYRYLDYPKGCETLPKLTITHDPAGAFDNRITGLVIGGHTHCGQVSLPFIGPLWIPTEAPKMAHCGLYEDSQRTVFVTSGVGTSVLPLRLGAQSQWDLIEIIWN